jgi:monovalent cation/proton antiporter MnhG/PhaG subunit
MDFIQTILGYALLLSGASCCLIAAIGCLRFDGFFVKSHAAGVNEIFGSILILWGIIILNGIDRFALKILLLIVIILVTSPTSTYILTQLGFFRKSKKEKHYE